jgi:hypothetical protein
MRWPCNRTESATLCPSAPNWTSKRGKHRMQITSGEMVVLIGVSICYADSASCHTACRPAGCCQHDNFFSCVAVFSRHVHKHHPNTTANNDRTKPQFMEVQCEHSNSLFWHMCWRTRREQYTSLVTGSRIPARTQRSENQTGIRRAT